MYCKLLAALANGSLYHCVQGLPRPICFSILECNSLIASGVRWLSNERETGLWILPLNQCRLWQLHRLECTYVNCAYYFFGKWQSYRMTIRQIFSEWELYRFFVQRAAVFFTERPYQLYSIPIVQSGFCGKWKSQTMAAAQIGFCIKWKSYRRQFYGEINHWELLCAIVWALPIMWHWPTGESVGHWPW